MSSIYVLEPRTRGRVVLKTSHGPVSVTLWTDEAPKAVRSFIVLALSGYYNGLCFHRVVPGLLVQTGDPTKTGTGGRAALKIAGEGRSIAREVHGRLKFRRRGIVALVADEAGQCGSQFFLTLDKADWLDGQHTIFGQVDGDTIFNLLNMANNGDVDGFDVPDAPILHSVEVKENPFEDLAADIEVENCPAKRNESEEGKSSSVREEQNGKKAIRNNTLLSFGNDEEEEDEDEEDEGDSERDAKAFDLSGPGKIHHEIVVDGAETGKPAGDERNDARGTRYVSNALDTVVAKRRRQATMQSSHDVLTHDITLSKQFYYPDASAATTTKVDKAGVNFRNNQVAPSQRESISDIAGSPSCAREAKRRELIAEAEREYANLISQAVRTSSTNDGNDKEDISGSNKYADPELPGRFSGLRRGNVRAHTGRNAVEEVDRRSRMREQLKQATAAAQHRGILLNFGNVSGTNGGDDFGGDGYDDYEVVDPRTKNAKGGKAFPTSKARRYV